MGELLGHASAGGGDNGVTAKALTFPNYVPEKVQLWAAQLQYGVDSDPSDNGWSGVLEGLKTQLEEVERRLRSPDTLPEETLSALHHDKHDLSARLDEVKRDLDCLERLTTRPDRDLQRTYAVLAEHLSDDEEIWSFIYAAIGANTEFTRYRGALRSARDCKEKIAKLAGALAEQLQKLEQTGVQAPDVFWSVQSLLGETDATGYNFTVWRQMRGRILGENCLGDAEDGGMASTTDDLDDDYDEDFPDDDFVVDELEGGATATSAPAQDRKYAWQVAPSVADLLQTLARAANDFEPREHHLIGAATGKRQDSEKAAYIRAFAHLLGECGIELTPEIKNAMATTATLVLNRHDLVVTLQDVGNTLSRR